MIVHLADVLGVNLFTVLTVALILVPVITLTICAWLTPRQATKVIVPTFSFLLVVGMSLMIAYWGRWH